MVIVMVVAMIVMLMVFVTFFVTAFVTIVPPFFPALLATLVRLLMAEVLLVVLTVLLTHVPRLVFPGPYEVHLPVARMILVAMQAPGTRVVGRNVQVQRFCDNHMRRRLLDDDWPGIDQRRRRPATEIDATINTWRKLSLNGH
jgi:hypothetical protein